MVPSSRHCLLLVGTLGVFVLERAIKGQRYSTLIFTLENTLRNCSCPADVRDCDYSLANLMCSCNTILPPAVERSASYDGRLTIWFTDMSALGRLLNFTLVHDLKLTLCSTNALPSAYLAICGLRRLRVSNEAKPEQSLFIHSSGDTGSEDKLLQSHKKGQPCTSVSFLDVALFNRNSSLKSYSIENVTSIVHSFPGFSYFKPFPMASNQSCVVTVIY